MGLQWCGRVLRTLRKSLPKPMLVKVKVFLSIDSQTGACLFACNVHCLLTSLLTIYVQTRTTDSNEEFQAQERTPNVLLGGLGLWTKVKLGLSLSIDSQTGMSFTCNLHFVNERCRALCQIFLPGAKPPGAPLG